jgi:alginate O-acetyltransferase complex protein AlgI
VLFNSYIYIFFFLPVSVIGYFLISRYGPKNARDLWLILVSFFFYGFWNPLYVPLLVGSIVFNYAVGNALAEGRALPPFRSRKATLAFGIVANILVLGIFKYTDFLIGNVNWLLGVEIPLQHIILPLALSFITFQKIAYLVDSYQGKTRGNTFLQFSMFVTFFPQLIAGPIVHWRDILPQFAERESALLNYRNIAAGLFIFFLGLVKKVGIADTFAAWANAGYAEETALTFFDAWATSLAYTFQLYFDFSGYTDMAIGSALLLNIVLPLNFNSPYKALDIQDFWRRWHMTLSRFLRDYLYIPLGGNREGAFRMYAAIFFVFLVGGMWHGASWTFVVWGMLHGIAVVVYRIWATHGPFALPQLLAWFLTFNFVNITWVFFRAPSFENAFHVLASMFGANGFSMSTDLFGKTQWLVEKIGFPIADALSRTTTLWIIAFLLIVVLLPNSNELRRLFKPTPLFMLACLVLYCIGIVSLSSFSEFIYFNF